jgi:hypothetical protein
LEEGRSCILQKIRVLELTFGKLRFIVPQSEKIAVPTSHPQLKLYAINSIKTANKINYLTKTILRNNMFILKNICKFVCSTLSLFIWILDPISMPEMSDLFKASMSTHHTSGMTITFLKIEKCYQ